MTITRRIADGGTLEIELTRGEIFRAYLQQEAEWDKMDVREYIKEYSSNSKDIASLTEEDIDIIAGRMRDWLDNCDDTVGLKLAMITEAVMERIIDRRHES